MKEGLIRMTINKNIFFDSITGEYKYRMHCPNCGIALDSCFCYDTLQPLLNDINDDIADFTCSAKCSLLYGNWDELDNGYDETGINISVPIEDLTEIQAKKILEYLTDGIDFDFPSCHECEI